MSTIKIYNNTARLMEVPPLSERTAAFYGDGKARNGVRVVPGQYVEIDEAHINALVAGLGKGGWYHEQFVTELKSGELSFDEAGHYKIETPKQRQTLIRMNEETTIQDVDIAQIEVAQASKVAPSRRRSAST